MLAVQVGEALGLPRRRLRRLALGGLLHDMGKLSVPSAVLRKPGPLDDAEFAEIRKHPEAGERLLRDLGGFAPEVRRLVLDHHERLDGSGYPRGLRGDELDVETRILAVCDVYDALVSDRVYRAGLDAGARAGAAARPRAVRPVLRRRARAPHRAGVRRRRREARTRRPARALRPAPRRA